MDELVLWRVYTSTINFGGFHVIVFMLFFFVLPKVADLSPIHTSSETNNPPQMVFQAGSKYWWNQMFF